MFFGVESIDAEFSALWPARCGRDRRARRTEPGCRNSGQGMPLKGAKAISAWRSAGRHGVERACLLGIEIDGAAGKQNLRRTLHAIWQSSAVDLHAVFHGVVPFRLAGAKWPPRSYAIRSSFVYWLVSLNPLVDHFPFFYLLERRSYGFSH